MSMVITYYANGEGVTNLPAAQTVEAQSDGTFKGFLSSQIPVREGYVFKGWTYSYSASQTYPYESFEAGFEFSFASSSDGYEWELYAIWNTQEEVNNAPTYTIEYDANLGTGAPESQTKDYAVSITLRSTIPTRAGMRFMGWNSEADGSGGTFRPGRKYWLNKNLTLYAIWSDQTYTVSFNANGGTGAPASQTKQYGIALTLTSTIPSKTGYIFKEWNTAEDGTGTTYLPGERYLENADMALYAIWEIGIYGSLVPGMDLSGRAIYNTVPASTGITTNKIIAKANNTNFFCESVSGGVTSGYYQWLKNDSTIGQVIFYRDGSSPIHLGSFIMPDTFGTLVEVDENAVLYPYLARQGHEKAYLVTEDMSFVEGVRKKDFDALVERVAALEND